MCRGARGSVKLATTVVLAALALAVTTGTSSAATGWDYESQPVSFAFRAVLPVGDPATVEVPAHFNKLSLTLKLPKHVAVATKCSASGTETFWDTSENGMDETRSLSFSCAPLPCGEVVVTPQLPWHGILLGTLATEPMVNEWAGVQLDLVCGGVDYGSFTGTLRPLSGDGDCQGPGFKEEHDSFLDFRGGQRLYGPNGAILTVMGYDHFGYQVGHKEYETVAGWPLESEVPGEDVCPLAKT